MDLMGFMEEMMLLSEMLRKNVTKVLSEERIMCVKYMVYETGKMEGDIDTERK